VETIDLNDQRSREVDAMFAACTMPATPGAAIAVVVGGEVVHLKGYGLANIEHAIPWTADTVAFVGSVTKHFTAIVTLLLEQDGALRLDDPVAAHLPELPACAAALTIRNLLANTSGLIDQDALMGMAGILDESPCSLDYLFRIAVRQNHLLCQPGRHYFYCNTSFLFLARIIERYSGRSFEACLTERIFTRLGMTRSSAPPGHKQVVARAATGYTAEPDGSFKVYRILPECSGDGAMRTTVTDMIRWIENLRDDRLGLPGLTRRLVELPTFADPDEASLYGLGTMVTRHRGMTCLGHTGSGGGFKAHFIYIPEIDTGVVGLSNRHDGNQMMDLPRIADIFAAPARVAITKSHEPPRPPASCEDAVLAGCYVNARTGFFLDVSAANDGVVVSILGDRDIAIMRHVGDDLYRPVGGVFSMPLRVVRHDNGAASDLAPDLAMNLDGSSDLVFTRVAPEETGPDDAAAAAGLYYNTSTTAFVAIESSGAELWLRRGQGQTPFHRHRMRRLLPDMFRADYVGADVMWRFKTYAVRLERDAAGAVRGIALSIGRARGIVFDRLGASCPEA
jgi:CubicO group peptidase (beta-lactamase class C family)